MSRAALGGALCAVLVMASCSSSRDERVVVSGAASLADALAITERLFEVENPSIDLQINTAGSSTLVNQILEGAPVDVLLTADTVAMASLDGQVSDVEVVAINRLIVLYRTDRVTVSGLDDLLDPELVVVACDTGLPCGRLTARALEEFDIDVPIDSRESSVRLARERVLSGEADAAFVYRTDANVDDRLIAAFDLADSTVFSEVTIASITDTEATRRFRTFFDAQGALFLEMAGFEIP